MVASARVVTRSRPSVAFNGVKVFSATMFADRDRLGETVTRWFQEHPQLDIVDVVVTQSSDAAYHCITITVFYFDRTVRAAKAT